MKRETILSMAITAVAVFNGNLETLKAMSGDYDSLVDRENMFYHCEPARVVKSGRGYRVVFRYSYGVEFLYGRTVVEKSVPIWIRDSKGDYKHNPHTYEGDGYKDYINEFMAGIRKGKRFFALPTETIDKLQGYEG